MTDQILETIEIEVEKRQNAEQDTKIHAAFSQTLTMIANLREHPEAAAVLAEHGYSDERLQEGIELCERTRETFHRRSAAITAQRHATAELNGLENKARAMYSDFRLLARGLYPGRESRSELGLSGGVPRDRSRFLSTATMSIAAARREPYASRFTEFGYGEETLNQMEEAVRALDHADTVQNNAIAEAVGITADRAKPTPRCPTG